MGDGVRLAFSSSPWGVMLTPGYMKINIQRVCRNGDGLFEEFKNGVTKLEQHSGQHPFLRDLMNDVANTVEYLLDDTPIPSKLVASIDC